MLSKSLQRLSSATIRRWRPFQVGRMRSLLTLAIESSCDDTSVAILETYDYHASSDNGPQPTSGAQIHFHQKITANNAAFGGVHPIISLESHQENLARLVEQAIQSLPHHTSNRDEAACSVYLRAGDGVLATRKKPDFISVTRGPGMRSCLSTGIDTAKGLAVAWQVPLVGVNHMQAHALTPRLLSALEADAGSSVQPSFPFLSLLVSGGHTMLVHSKALAEHATLAATSDVAIGDAIDKIARVVLPPESLTTRDTMYGRLLERFAFPSGACEYRYVAPARRGAELARKPTRWGWSIGVPLAETRSGLKSKSMEYTFTGIQSACTRIARERVLSLEERRDLAREAMRVGFEHLASRVVMALQDVDSDIQTLVVSGGVASNGYLRAVLRAFLDIRGYRQVALKFPPPPFCTDNAAMIAWAGIEMFQAGWESGLGCKALRKWSIDANAVDGGILGATDWKRTSRILT